LHRFVLTVMLASAAGPASAQSLRDIIPLDAAHCALTAAPPDAGIAATPGGFVMVFPRNAALSDEYTGCKVMWIVDTDQLRRFATLYFIGGKLKTAVAHEIREPAAPLLGACAFRRRSVLWAATGDLAADLPHEPRGRSVQGGPALSEGNSRLRIVPVPVLCGPHLPRWSRRTITCGRKDQREHDQHSRGDRQAPSHFLLPSLTALLLPGFLGAASPLFTFVGHRFRDRVCDGRTRDT
jgi:hypothetical protein